MKIIRVYQRRYLKLNIYLYHFPMLNTVTFSLRQTNEPVTICIDNIFWILLIQINQLYLSLYKYIIWYVFQYRTFATIKPVFHLKAVAKQRKLCSLKYSRQKLSSENKKSATIRAYFGMKHEIWTSYARKSLPTESKQL